MRYDDVQGEWGFEDSQNPWTTIEDFNSELLGENLHASLCLTNRFEERVLYHILT